MKKRMKKKCKYFALFLVCILLVGVVSLPVSEAASKKTAACKAYKKFLKKNVSHYTVEEGDWESKNTEKRDKCWGFLLVDLDRDGTPELVTNHETGYRQGFLNVYVYKNGKVQYAKTKKGNKVKISISCNAAGWWDVYSCKKGHLHTEWQGGMMGQTKAAYMLKEGKLNKYLYGCWETTPDGENNRFYKNGKAITETKFDSLYSKCKAKEELHKNTKKNRNKFLK